MLKIKNKASYEKVMRIYECIHNAPRPVWLHHVAKETGLTAGLAHYFIFGQFKTFKGGVRKFYGGYLKDDVLVLGIDGKNKLMFLKVREKDLKKLGFEIGKEILELEGEVSLP